MSRALAVDRFPGVTEYDLERSVVGMVGDPAGTVVAVEGDLICGYASPRGEDLAVDPDSRRRGHGRRLLAAAGELAERIGLPELRLYVPPGDTPGMAFARATGLVYRSSLWLLELAPEAPVPAPDFPADTVARGYGDWLSVGRLVALMNDAFVGHPSPAHWTEPEIALANSRPDFDPADVLVVSAADPPGEPVGFARTRVRPPEDDDPSPVGEVALLGVVPDWRGRGLGRALLRWGIAHVRERGCGRTRLIVETGNERAIGLYERTGFRALVEWPHWSPPAATGAE